MKFGICCPEEFIPSASEAGFDYVELGVSSCLRPDERDESHIEAVSLALHKARLRSESLNFMLPAGFHCVGWNVDEQRLENYFRVAARRAAAVGAKALVFGSGTQRMIPDGFQASAARGQYKQALRLVGNEAERYGIVVVIEPLNHLESNLINSVAEGVELAKEIGHPSVKVLSDLYHVETDQQLMSETTDAGPLLAHVHIAGAGRRAPIEDDLETLTKYFNAVKAAGYDDRVSIEVNWKNMAEEAPVALDVTKRAWVLATASH
jgi:D-psicose/D-tagatose/L-ribulose 3-epimerase